MIQLNKPLEKDYKVLCELLYKEINDFRNIHGIEPEKILMEKEAVEFMEYWVDTNTELSCFPVFAGIPVEKDCIKGFIKAVHKYHAYCDCALKNNVRSGADVKCR